ncbi:MAG TPA: ECF RNA polymerase sigma factor SigK [Propionibacteriaceae bacterium]|nr:ECF RNA polymerase sigma factor SigK [Propionibacteriaceae bacterium]
MVASPRSGSGPQPWPEHGREPAGRDLAAAHLIDLVTKCATGDQTAFDELYQLTVRRVYGAVLRVLRSPDQAQEVTQEVYVEVWRQAPTYQADKGSVVGWVTTMAHRRAVDRVRSVSSEVARDQRYAQFDLDRESDQVWDSVAQKHDVERVREALLSLTPFQRQAILLAYYEGLTQTRIAATLHLPLGTVKTRIRDGLKRLGAALGGAEA